MRVTFIDSGEVQIEECYVQVASTYFMGCPVIKTKAQVF